MWAEEYACGQKIAIDDWEERANAPKEDDALHFKFSWKKLWRFAGPGWLMSLAYLDPGNLESNLQQGAYTKYDLVWVLWWSTVTGLILQEMSARIGLVTGRDLAQNVREEYPIWVARLVYFAMELAVIGADIQEVVGSGIAFNILSFGSVPVWAGCLITALDTFTFLAVGYFGVRYLEALIVCFIAVMLVCFLWNWAATDLDSEALVMGWAIPSLPAYGFTQAVGTLGAVIMPHNLYLHSGLVLSRKIQRSSPQRVHEALSYARIEMAVALFVAFCINLSIVSTNAASFFAPECASADDGPFACLSHSAYKLTNGPHAHPTPAEGLGAACTIAGAGAAVRGHCGEIGLENAGTALEDTVGFSALTVWALGMLAAGQASTMVCTYAGQIIMSGLLSIELPPWKRVALTRVIALGPALGVALLTTSQPGALNVVNECLNVLQSVLLPFAMLPALHFAADEELLGVFQSSTALICLSTILAIIVMSTNALLVQKTIKELGASPMVVVVGTLLGLAYASFCLRLIWTDLVASARRVGRCIAAGCTLLRFRIAIICDCGREAASTSGTLQEALLSVPSSLISPPKSRAKHGSVFEAESASSGAMAACSSASSASASPGGHCPPKR